MRSIPKARRRNLVLVVVLAIALLPTIIRAGADAPDNPVRPNLHDYTFSDMSLASIIKTISEQDCLSVIFDKSIAAAIENTRATLKITNSSAARAIQFLLKEYELDHEYIGHKTLVVFKGETPKSVKTTSVVMRSMSLDSFAQQI